jgi:predicted MFS family arabinose efflux permease
MYAMLTMALVPVSALAPYAGGLPTRYLGWQYGFVVLALAAALIVMAGIAWLPETRRTDVTRDTLRLVAQSRALLKNKLFMGYVLQAA